jgi:methionyl-tRNA formyltransferase
MNSLDIKYIFFGTDKFATAILDELKKSNFLPTIIITTEDKPKGRNLLLTPPEVKVWAEKENIPYFQFKSLKNKEAEEQIKSWGEFDVFIVASYGKIIPENILNLPKFKTINVHPSLLPKWRGPSPIESSILNDNETGVTIMRLDNEVDHGPILEQEKIEILNWPPYKNELLDLLAVKGAELLVKILPLLISSQIEEKEQNHSKATFCQKIKKSDGEINLADSAEKNLRKIRAFDGWPTAYFFMDTNGKRIRIIIKKASLDEGKLVIERIIPEGKKEMDYKDFIRNQKNY